MNKLVHVQDFLQFDIPPEKAILLCQQINPYLTKYPAEEAWRYLTQHILSRKNKLPFSLHYFIFTHLFPQWPKEPDCAPAWIPTKEFINSTNLARSMAQLKIYNYREFHSWSVNHFEKYWQHAIKKLNIKFQKDPTAVCNLQNIESPHWFPHATLNIIESCFNAPSERTAIIYQEENSDLRRMTYDELNRLSNRIANSIINEGLKAGDAIAIDLPMTYLAIAIYLGVIKMGGVVVSIADSFSKEEIAIRLKIANTKLIFTQDFILRDSKKIPLYEKVRQADAPPAIVIRADEKDDISLRSNDKKWADFLVESDTFKAVPCSPDSHCNILFSSGTTGTPKAIPWNHTTPIKVGADAYFHHNIQEGDVLAWPTNLGWMMGPWLIFATFLNKATMAIYDGVPRTQAFGKFIQDAKVTMLGVVPTLVSSWRQSKCMEEFNWESIKLFSSTGECSNPEDMLYLMFLANYKPIIEYCGGTEIGGAYITSSLLEMNYPSLCTTPALGINFILMDETGAPTTKGEVALIPPSIGLSTELINADHHDIYYKNMPETPEGKKLRRHGDQIQQLSNGCFWVLGRADDTMNLGAIKVSSAEIERVLAGIEGVTETAAIAVAPVGGGPSALVIFTVVTKSFDTVELKQIMQKKINLHLNPLFKINDVVIVLELPKTASNKIMRRVLREQYIENEKGRNG